MPSSTAGPEATATTTFWSGTSEDRLSLHTKLLLLKFTEISQLLMIMSNPLYIQDTVRQVPAMEGAGIKGSFKNRF
jgi:hypothetical protein